MKKTVKIVGRELEVYSDGRIFQESFKDSMGRGHGGNFMKLFCRSSGPYVAISIDGKQKNLKVSRLVAKAFIDNPRNYPIVDHKDNNPLNNDVSNLRWVNASINGMAARRPQPRKTSSFRGVRASHYKKIGWQAGLCNNGKYTHIGVYDTEEEAARARDLAAIKAGYPVEGLNFPEEHENNGLL